MIFKFGVFLPILMYINYDNFFFFGGGGVLSGLGCAFEKVSSQMHNAMH